MSPKLVTVSSMTLGSGKHPEFKEVSVVWPPVYGVSLGHLLNAGAGGLDLFTSQRSHP